MATPSPLTLETHDAAACWRRLADCVDGLVAAWRSGARDFSLADFLPAEPATLRRMALVELIKVDMEQRLTDDATFKTVEQYLVEFPELAVDGEAPCDLIYEEYHLRKVAQPSTHLQDYFTRFPNHAERLARLLKNDDVTATTSLTRNLRRPQTPSVGERLDEFDLLARLGQGAFATVFLARQRSLERLVALKVSDDRGSEPQTLALLDHPNIVRVFDQRRLPSDRLRLLYMQFIPGGTLQAVIRRHNQLPSSAWSGATFLAAINEALARNDQGVLVDSAARHRLQSATWPEVVCWLGARLATALAYAHEHGVLHRDVKPANVLLGRDGSPKLVDFNISFSSKLDGATPAAYFGGSLAYMSPEQLEACDPAHPRKPEELDGRSDVYSLAIVVWELLTGQRPFVDHIASGDWGKTLSQMAEQRRAGIEPATLENWPANCPPGLRETLLMALSGDRDRRTPSAAEFARGLELSLIPRAQRLLGTGGQRLLSWRFPITSLVVGGLAPNLVMSVLNIIYNWSEVVRHLTLADQRVFFLQLLIVNGIAYAWGVAMALYLCWPVVVSMRELRSPHDRPRATPRRLARLRARTLWLGDYAAWICAIDWAFSGFVFPSWMQAQVGANTAITTSLYVHFVVSQALCGLIAATLTFFMVTLGALRTCYPRLVGPAAGPTPQPNERDTAASDKPRGKDAAGSKLASPPAQSVANELPADTKRSGPRSAEVNPTDEDAGPATDVVLADMSMSGKPGAARPSSAAWDGVALRFPSGAPSVSGERDSAHDREASDEEEEPSDIEQLRSLAQRVWLYFGMAVVAPFLAVMVVVLLNDDRGAIGGLGIVGLVAFGLAFCMALVIRGDVAALSIAMRPSGGSMSNEEELSNSFWTGSRR